MLVWFLLEILDITIIKHALSLSSFVYNIDIAFSKTSNLCEDFKITLFLTHTASLKKLSWHLATSTWNLSLLFVDFLTSYCCDNNFTFHKLNVVTLSNALSLPDLCTLLAQKLHCKTSKKSFFLRYGTCCNKIIWPVYINKENKNTNMDLIWNEIIFRMKGRNMSNLAKHLKDRYQICPKKATV